MPDWYNWRLENWGCKWDCAEAQIDEWDGGAIYSFDTPWGPPIEWLERTCVKFPNLKFLLGYREDGMQFQGVVEFEDGIVTKSEDQTWFPLGNTYF